LIGRAQALTTAAVALTTAAVALTSGYPLRDLPRVVAQGRGGGWERLSGQVPELEQWAKENPRRAGPMGQSRTYSRNRVDYDSLKQKGRRGTTLYGLVLETGGSGARTQ